MADLMNIDPELLRRAYGRSPLAASLQGGLEGFKQGTDIGISLAEQRAKRKKEEADLMAQIKQLALQNKQQLLKEREASAGMITPELSKKATKEMTPEVYKTLFPEVKAEENAPTGYRFTSTGSLEPIAGSAEAVKREKEIKAEKATFNKHLADAKFAKKFIEDTIPKVTVFTAGPGAILSKIPGTPSKNLASDIQSIKSRLGLDALMAAKSLSSTGASGFGQLSDKEMEILQAQIANLDQSQDYNQLKDRLTMVKTHYDNALSLIQGKNPYNDKNPAPDVTVPAQVTPGGLTPEQRKRRDELRAKKAAGTLR